MSTRVFVSQIANYRNSQFPLPNSFFINTQHKDNTREYNSISTSIHRNWYSIPFLSIQLAAVELQVGDT